MKADINTAFTLYSLTTSYFEKVKGNKGGK